MDEIIDNAIPRRNQLEKLTPAEKSILNAMYEVEILPAHEKLTEAVTLLARAKELVADFVDFVEQPS